MHAVVSRALDNRDTIGDMYDHYVQNKLWSVFWDEKHCQLLINVQLNYDADVNPKSIAVVSRLLSFFSDDNNIHLKRLLLKPKNLEDKMAYKNIAVDVLLSHEDFSEVKPFSRMKVSFLTPTICRNGSAGNLPIMSASSLIRSLHKKWNDNLSIEHPIERIDYKKIDSFFEQVNSPKISDDIEIIRHKNNSKNHNYKDGVSRFSFKGVIGEVEYICKNQEKSKIIYKLLKYGECMGVGARTCYGFGRMKILEIDD